MFRMLLANVFYTKIIHAEGKGDWPPVMRPKTGCEYAQTIFCFVQAFFSQFFGQYFSWWKSIHSLSDFNVDIIIPCDFFREVVVFDGVVREITEL